MFEHTWLGYRRQEIRELVSTIAYI